MIASARARFVGPFAALGGVPRAFLDESQLRLHELLPGFDELLLEFAAALLPAGGFLLIGR